MSHVLSQWLLLVLVSLFRAASNPGLVEPGPGLSEPAPPTPPPPPPPGSAPRKPKEPPKLPEQVTTWSALKTRYGR